jgi:hypothetical protein
VSMSRLSIALLLLAALALPALAQDDIDDKTVPPELLSAEKIFVQQTLIDPRIVSRFRSEIAKWERFEVVTSAEGADLVAVLSAEVAYTQTVAESEGAGDDGTGESSRSSGTGVRPLGTVRTLNDVHLTISIPNGNEVWTDVVPVTGMSGGAAKRLVKRLRGRIEDED